MNDSFEEFGGDVLVGLYRNADTGVNKLKLDPEIHNTLFDIWFDSLKAGPKRRSYKVPFRIQLLSCGCCRERGNESDPNSVWYVKRKGGKYTHTECNSEL